MISTVLQMLRMNDRDESQMASGTLFQVRGPAMDLSPNEAYVYGTWSFPLSA